MNTNKTVTIRTNKIKMYQNGQTGWVFAQGPRSKRFFDIGKIVDGQIVAIETPDAVNGITNEELLNAWLNS